MRSVPKLFAWLIFTGLLVATSVVWSAQEKTAISQSESSETSSAHADDAAMVNGESGSSKPNRVQVLIASLTVFTLAVIVGFEIIAKVPPTLHTPLMSGSNAISGITVVGALVAAGNHQGGFASFLGLLAVVLANINVVGGFWVTHRMLLMFKKK
jgi:H+-translocating NAD(P) transhydrogenase subunit alpha